MKTTILSVSFALFVAAAVAAESSPKEELAGAVEKLSKQDNYSWNTKTEFGNFPPGSTDGKADKEGLIQLSMAFGDNKTEAFLQGSKGAAKSDGEWQSLKDLSSEQRGPRSFLARILENYKAPAVEAADLLSKAKEIKKADDAFSADLTEEGAKSLLMFRRRGGDAPEAKNAKGSVKFWVKDGVLSKYQYKLEGTINFGGEDRDVDRTTTIELKDLGKTKIEMPEDAKKKLS